jgi:RNA polymerase sigma-70 factor, ECF subfamily
MQSRWNERDPDRALLDGARGGDRAALAELYRRYSAPVYRMALALTQDESRAAQVTTDTFLWTWAVPDTWNSAACPRVELMARTRWVAQRFARSGGGGVAQVLAGLPPEEREAVELACFGRLTYREIAQVTGSDAMRTAARLRRALRRLAAGRVAGDDSQARRPVSPQPAP